MARVGRKPLETGHVQRLDGSAHAKRRLTVFLETLRGQMTVPDACQALGIGEARFHVARQQWLQEALQLLEPRKTGRPAKAVADPPTARCEQENAALRQQLQQLQTQLDLQRSLAEMEAANASPIKKTAGGEQRGRSARRGRPR